MSATTPDGQAVWERVLEDAKALAAELRVDGWDVLIVRADHVAAVSPRESTERHGLIFTAPDSVAEQLPDLIDGGSFDRYEVHREDVAENRFLAIRIRDDETERGVVLVGVLDWSRIGDLADAAREREQLHSHVRLLDGTHVATFRHEDPSLFFPGEE
ncbi:DUF7529 family protein [Halorhabdus rudnickae]|uniref:DUF7529 family protein n=1 Tax=Halorhabdus rudnickae TaxID=1775544 RepID=UPI00108265E2|nr:hypothetical protein [Halorhabdus rudnickae]